MSESTRSSKPARRALSCFCADIAIDRRTGDRIRLWRPESVGWRHEMCRATRGVFLAGYDGEGSSRHKLIAQCVCPCHDRERRPGVGFKSEIEL